MNTEMANIANIASVEAARYLGLEYTMFMNYVTTGKIVYTLKQWDKYYSKKELDRFKNEVLNNIGLKQ